MTLFMFVELIKAMFEIVKSIPCCDRNFHFCEAKDFECEFLTHSFLWKITQSNELFLSFDACSKPIKVYDLYNLFEYLINIIRYYNAADEITIKDIESKAIVIHNVLDDLIMLDDVDYILALIEDNTEVIDRLKNQSCYIGYALTKEDVSASTKIIH